MNNFSLNFPTASETLCYSSSTMEQQPSSFPLLFCPNKSNYDDNNSDQSSTNFNYSPTHRSETASSSNNNHHHEHMFEKPLTPSDVGKLNRLVIPKQHAEKYFPLAGVSTSGDVSGAGDKTTAGGGVLLGFEDEAGKCWRFRYSYWNSSQSYVLTKGWSRYVKEKKLDAGDVVLFERHRYDSDRFFIGWRRRGSPPVHSPVQFHGRPVGDGWTGGGGGQRTTTSYNNVVQRNPQLQGFPASHRIAAFQYQPGCLHAGTQQVGQQNQKAGNSKRLRLFGVNLECQLEEEEEITETQTSDGSSLSSQGQAQAQAQAQIQGPSVGPTAYNYFDYVGYPSSVYPNHMDMNFQKM